MDERYMIFYHPTTKAFTYNNFKKVKLTTELKKQLKKNDAKKCSLIVSEFVISEQTDYLIEKMFLFYCSNIHRRNPNILILLHQSFKKYITLKKNKEFGSLKNNQEIRNLFCEISCVLATSPKEKMAKPETFKKHYLNLSNIRTKIKVSDFNLIKGIIQEGDPKLFYIPLNEIANSLEDKNGFVRCLFWYDWIERWITRCKRKYGKKMVGAVRKVTDINKRFQNDIVWIIWEIVFSALSRREGRVYYTQLYNHIDLLYTMYKHGFTPGKRKTRRSILHYTFLLLVDSDCVSWSQPIIHNAPLTIKLNMNINTIYLYLKQIRQKCKKELDISEVMKLLFSNRMNVNPQFNNYMTGLNFKQKDVFVERPV